MRCDSLTRALKVYSYKNVLIIECKNRLKMIGRLDTVYEINNGLEDQE
jgi:hypothetical protein